MSEFKFIIQINQWLESNSQNANIKCEFKKEIAIGLFANKAVLEEVIIEYELMNSVNTYVYNVTKYDIYVLVQKESSQIIEKWKKENPGKIVVGCSMAQCSRGTSSSLVFGGLGACNRISAFILYKYAHISSALYMKGVSS